MAKMINTTIEQLQKHPDSIVRCKVTRDVIGFDPYLPVCIWVMKW